MIVKMELNIAPLSLNHAEQSTSQGRRYKTESYKNFKTEAIYHLEYFMPELKKVRTHFIDTKHVLIVRYKFYIPLSKYFTKLPMRKLSARGGDADNYVKPITDIIFKEMDVDDRYVYRFEVEKFPADKARIDCEIEMVRMSDIPEIRDFYNVSE